MKRILIPVAVAVTVAMCMSSCETKPDIQPTNEQRLSVEESIKTIEFDGHQYLIYDGYKAGSMCHSESCPCKSK